MPTTYNSLLVDNAKGWHDGTGTVTYSFLGTTMPAYYPERDIVGTSANDAWKLGRNKFVDLNADFSMTPAERALSSLAIEAWNEVANINLVPGTISGTSGDDDEGSEIAGNGNFVNPGGFSVPTNDDGFTTYDFSAVFEDGINFFGNNYDAEDVYVNTNGSISFVSGISTFTPTSISGGSTPMIAPFWGDVDTRAGSPIYVDVDPATDVVSITWENVGYYSMNTSPLNSFQLQLFDRGGGDFDIVFRYESINWTTGDASGGENGLGGTVARAGYSAGNGADYFELPQSGSQSGILGLDGITGNTGITGLWVFEVRNGVVAGDITFGSADILKSDGTDRKGLYGFVSGFPKPNKLGETPSKHGDVWINSTNNKQEVNAYGHTSWNTYLHELGHGLGLKHPDQDPNNKTGTATNNNQYTVMSYVEHPGESGLSLKNQAWPLTPQLYDIQAIQKLYGPNLTTRTEDTTYFGAGDGSTATAYQYAADGMKVAGSDGVDRHVILTIWDAGGIDLIDASDLSTDSKINLKPATFSTIGSLENNVAMAAAVKVEGETVNFIENAEGGSGADVIKGNAAENELTGNGGKDKLYGFGNDDILDGSGGRDKLFGGGGDDLLLGGNGNDVLKGQGGDDIFAILDGEGRDKIKDFQDNADTLLLDTDLWDGSKTAQEVIDEFASAANGNTTFEFDDGEKIILLGVADPNALANDIDFI